jgi:DNA-binding beta-propeller fold protein YncE
VPQGGPAAYSHEVIAVTRMPATALVLSIALVAPALSADPGYRIVERLKMPDGGWDYAASDPERGLIYSSRTGFTDVIDARTGNLSQLKSTGSAHVALPVPGTTLIVLPLRSPAKMVRIVDTATDKVVADLPAGEAPDSATYDPFSKHVFVINRNDSTATEIDPLANKVVATIDVGGGKLEFTDADGLGHVFVNVAAAGEIAVIDVSAKTVIARYKMAGCTGASGLAYAGKSGLLLAACGSGVAKVLAADTGKEVASIAIGKGPDAVAYDPAREIAFIPCGTDGVLEIVSIADPARVALIQHLPTQVSARTGAVDRQSGRFYAMAAQPDPDKPGRNGRPMPKDGSFEMLVVAPQ